MADRAWDAVASGTISAVRRVCQASWGWRLLAAPLAAGVTASAWLSTASSGAAFGAITLAGVIAVVLSLTRPSWFKTIWKREARWRAERRLAWRWPAAARKAGLIWDGDVPAVCGIHTIGHGIRLSVRLPEGMSADFVRLKTGNLESALDVNRVQVRRVMGAVACFFVTTRPLPERVAFEPSFTPADPDTVWLGVGTRGHATWTVGAGHTLVSGRTSSGKTELIDLVATQLLRQQMLIPGYDGPLDRHDVRIITSKPVGFERLELRGAEVGRGLPTAACMVGDLVLEMARRFEDVLRPVGRSHWDADVDGPWIDLFVDEFVDLVTPAPGGKNGPSADVNALHEVLAYHLDRLLRTASAAGIRLWLAAQRVDVVQGGFSGLARSNLAGRIAIGVGEHDGATASMMFGDANLVVDEPFLPGRALVAHTSLGEFGDIDVVQLGYVGE